MIGVLARPSAHPDGGAWRHRVTATSKPSPSRPQWLGWLAIALIAAFPLAEAIRILVQEPQPVLYGDLALLDLGARRAAHFDQLVGPYSRAGFHQPGPAVFYLLAPFTSILGSAGAGLYLGAILFNGGALVASVAVVWRRLGPVAALWAASAIGFYCLCVRVGTFREPWNPYLIVAPMVLFIVLWAAAMTGGSATLVWALVVGSFEIQTHIATAGLVVTMSVVMVVAATLRRWHRPASRDALHRPGLVSGAIVLVALWLPPLVDVGRDRPSNLQVLWDYFTSAHSKPSIHSVLDVAAQSITIVPFGNRDYALALHRSPAELAIAAGLMSVGLVAATALAWRRAQPMSLALAASALVGAVVGTISLALGSGPVYLYYTVWLAYVPLAILLALGTAVFGQSSPVSHVEKTSASSTWPRPRLALCVVAAIAVGALTVHSDLGMAGVATTTGAGPWPQADAGSAAGRTQTVADTASLTAAAEHVLRPSDRRVNFTIGTPGLWPYVAGMVLALDERGVQSTVSPASWELYFGHERAPDLR